MALILSVAGMLMMGLVGVSQSASADTGPAVTTAPDITPQQCTIGQGVDIFGPDGRRGQYICGTVPVPGSGVTVVIGTDYRVYQDFGRGWSVVPGGVALHTTNPNQIVRLGVFVVNSNTIEVLGTTGHYFCNTTTSPGHWIGWKTAGCPQ